MKLLTSMEPHLKYIHGRDICGFGDTCIKTTQKKKNTEITISECIHVAFYMDYTQFAVFNHDRIDGVLLELGEMLKLVTIVFFVIAMEISKKIGIGIDIEKNFSTGRSHLYVRRYGGFLVALGTTIRSFQFSHIWYYF